MLNFSINIRKDRSLGFGSWPTNERFLLLTYIFGNHDLVFYNELLFEITNIQVGVKENSEEMILADIPEWSSLLVYKEKTLMELIESDGGHKCLEIPTSDFKQLIEDWIKFVEVNTAAFAKK